MDFTIKAVGPDVGDVVDRQIKQFTAANRKVGAAVNRAGTAAMRKGAPRSFAGYALKIKGKVTSSGGDHVEVRFQGSPVGFWCMLESGAKPHKIRPRKAKALSFGGHVYEEVNHPGMAGRGSWSKLQPALKAAVSEAVDDTYTAVIARG